MRYFLLLYIILLPLKVSNYSISFKYEKQPQKIELQEMKDSLYEFFIDFIKKHEGFRSKPYHTGIDTDGMTIGYGHLIKKGEIFDSVTKLEAEMLLRKDFNNAILLIKKHTKLKKHNEVYSMAHFVFAKGIGKFLKSDIRKKIDLKEDFYEDLMKYSIYRKKGVIYKSETMLKNRLIEYNIFNNYEIFTDVRLK